MKNFVLKGNICYCCDKSNINICDNSYLVCIDGICQGVFDKLSEDYTKLPLIDYSDKLIIPGLTDLHTHAPQFAFRGLNMDMELLQWLDTTAFVEESKYSDLDYAQKAYKIFADTLKNGATTRACVFATVHKESSKLLMDLMEHSGTVSYVGKVNMDRNCPNSLCETDAEVSLKLTEEFIKESHNIYKNTYPILTPRFIPSCTDELMYGLAKIKAQHNLPVQSHLSENKSEINWVSDLCPDSTSYTDAYDKYGLLKDNSNIVMAHCVHLTDDEQKLIKDRGVYIAHCPASNSNLSSGIAPIKRYLNNNLKVGLGSDMAGGQSDSIFRAMVDAIQVSKLYHTLVDNSLKSLTFAESFYMATKGGGEFFGKVGSFEYGYEFDAVVIDDSILPHPQTLTTIQRLERCVYLGADLNGIVAKFVRGKKII